MRAQDKKKKNPNHLNKYKRTATEQDLKHIQHWWLLYSWINDCSEQERARERETYINFHIYKNLN